MRRVVITGQGTINPLGNSASETLESFRTGRCGIGDLKIRDADRLMIRIGGQVKNFAAADYFSRQELALYDRFTQFALLAADEALSQSGIDLKGNALEEAGVVLGTAGGGLNTWDASYRSVYQEGKNRVHPFVVPKLMNNAAASHVSMKFNLRGPSFSVSTACSSSNHAIGLAFQLVKSGMAKTMVAGGAESMLCFGGVKAWEGLRVMSPIACRPFSKNRNGMVQGEGAALFVIEDFKQARLRRAEILAEIVGFSMTSDADDIVMPSRSGAARAIRGALTAGNIAPDSVGYINAHGTGTIANDRTECAAIIDVFGGHADSLLLSSTKSMHGHLIGGTGSVELLACIMALREGVIAPTIGFEEPDPECPLDIVPNEARNADISVAMSNSFAFGGLNAVLVLKSV